MNSPIQTSTRPSPLPAHYASMIFRIDSTSYQITGLPIDANDPIFRDRREAEDWLAERLPVLHPRLKRGPRACLTCKTTFISDGLHNRLCKQCRCEE